jgi:hypothetical protein
VWGNGLGQSFFLAVTLSSGQAEWPASPSNHSFKVHSCEQFRRMVRYRKFGRTVISIRKWFGQSFPRADSFSPGCIVISVGRMVELGEWSRFSNQGHAFPGIDSFSPGCTVISAEGMAQLGEWSRLRNQGQLFFYAWEE